MILLPDGWRAETAVGAVVFANPERTMQVHYRMRVAPLRTFAAIVDETIRARPEFRVRTVGERQRFLTHEGEHAIGAAIDGAWMGVEARRYVAAIYGDDYYNVLDAIAIGPAPVDVRARVLAHSASLHLGVRRRRYFYDRPAGWHGHATGLVTHWFPAMFPRRPASIIVYPANPTHEEPQAVFDAVVAHQKVMGADVDAIAHPDPIVARQGLEGLHWQVALSSHGGPPVHRDLVVFVRGSLTYALQLDVVHAVDEDARTTFLALARSVEPVPHGGAFTAASEHGLFSHYA